MYSDYVFCSCSAILLSLAKNVPVVLLEGLSFDAAIVKLESQTN